MDKLFERGTLYYAPLFYYNKRMELNDQMLITNPLFRILFQKVCLLRLLVRGADTMADIVSLRRVMSNAWYAPSRRSANDSSMAFTSGITSLRRYWLCQRG